MTHEETLRRLAAKRGIVIEPFGHAGAVRVMGHDVYILAAALRHVTVAEVAPKKNATRSDRSTAAT